MARVAQENSTTNQTYIYPGSQERRGRGVGGQPDTTSHQAKVPYKDLVEQFRVATPLAMVDSGLREDIFIMVPYC